MNPSVLKAKLRVPTLPAAHLIRARLDRLWEGAGSKRLVLICAGAGSGKTCYLSSIAARDGRRSFWLSIDELDVEPARFFAHVGAMVAPLDRESETSRIGQGDPTDPSLPHRLLAYLLRGLEKQTALFFFDDAHLVARRPEIMGFFESLVRFVPDGSTIVISSREPLMLPVSKLQMEGRVASIGSGDLQFREEEIEDLLRLRFPGVSCEPGLAHLIRERTEGWAAGIEILFQAAGGGSAWAIREALDRLTSTGPGYFAYFAEEVISRLDPAMRDFLYRSSVLPRLDPALCNSVLGREDSGPILEDLARRNLFTFAIDDARGAYRYHHLFREFLQEHLMRDRPAEAQVLRLRAARALAESGAWAEAAVAYARGGDPEATIELIETHGGDLFVSGQYGILSEAFNSIPAALLERHPIALSVLGRLHEIRGRWGEAREVYQRALPLVPRGAGRAELLALVARDHIRRGEYDAGIGLCREALRRAGRANPRLRGRVLCLLGVADAELGMLDSAEKRLTRARDHFRRLGEPSEEGRALFLLAANVHNYRGDFRRAKDAGREALVIFQRLRDPRQICHTMMGLGLHSAACGEESEGRDLLEKALRLAERLEYRMAEGYCHIGLGRCALLAHETAAARTHFDHARQLGESLQEVSLQTWSRMGLAEAALAEGNFRGARMVANEALGTAQDCSDRFVEGQSLALLGFAHQDSDPQAASRLRRRAERIFREMGARCELHKVLLARLAAGEIARGRRLATIEELLRGTAELGHEFLLLSLYPEKAGPILCEALRSREEARYASSLLVRLGHAAIPLVASLLKEASDEIGARAVDVITRIGGDVARKALACLASDTTPGGRASRRAIRELAGGPIVPLRIRALGPLAVEVGDYRIKSDGWQSKRARRLFQLLLVHRFRWVPRDEILDTLWPDADPDRGENNLRQSIHILRRVLVPGVAGSAANQYVRLHDGSYRLDPGEAHTYDVTEFEAAVREGLILLDRGKKEEAERRLRVGLETYRGCFLAEFPYEDFVAAEREGLRERFLVLVCRLLGVLSAAARWDECLSTARRGLAEDPFHEDCYWHLAHAHLRLRNRKEALAVCHEYERMVTRELDIPPSIRMRLLAEEAASTASAGRFSRPS